MRLSIGLSLLLACLHQSSSSAAAYKILVYNSKFGHSHSNFLGQIADTLVDAGHNVTSLMPIMDARVRDGTQKSRKIYVQPDPVTKALYENIDEERKVNFFELNPANPIIPFFVGPMFGDTFYRNCKKVIAEPGLLEMLKAEKFDVMIAENFDVCGIGLSAVIAPRAMVAVSSTCLFGWQFVEFGVEQALSYRPTSLSASFDPHSLLSRLYNLYGDLIGRFTFSFSRSSVNRALQEAFGPDYPTVAELSSRVAYVFTNSEPLIESATPTTSRIINVGGIGAKQPKPLDEYWESVLTRRPRTVLLSFGSIARSILIPTPAKMGILKAIAQFPEVTFIWKYEEPEDEFAVDHAAKIDNLVLTKWMPQVDILAHPNLAVFITHGGMGSTQETALRGVPGIFIPLFADQPRNAGMMEFNGFGKVFDKFALADGDKLAATIREVVGDAKYRENARRISAMLAAKPYAARDLLIKHVEFAAEFGASAALRPQSVDMSTIAYLNLDVLALIAMTTVLFAAGSLKISAVLIRKVLRLAKHKTD